MTDALRVLAREQGWGQISTRSPVLFIEVLAVVAVAGVGGLVAFTWKMPRGVKIAALGLTVLDGVRVAASRFVLPPLMPGSPQLPRQAQQGDRTGGVGVVTLGAVLVWSSRQALTPSWGRARKVRAWGPGGPRWQAT